MRVHQSPHGFWDREPTLSLGCKRLRPPAAESGAIDLKSFIKAESGSGIRRVAPPEPVQGIDTHPGGTRWNPTAEQIAALEAFYRGGMRTPNSEQIERITIELGRFGKIEGKNVFYWFQNHKARERQKQKRSNLGLFHFCGPSSPLPSKLGFPLTEWGEDAPNKKWRSLAAVGNMEFDPVGEVSPCFNEDDGRTLELFPLHPEGRP